MIDNCTQQKILTLAKTDTEYQSALSNASRLEQDFLRLRESLSSDQQSVLDAYLSACEEMDHALLRIACSMICP